MNDAQFVSVTIEVTVAAPVAEVWASLREPARIRRWHGWEYDQLDEEIRMIFVDGVTADEDAFTLLTGGGDRIQLEPSSRGTRVILTRAEGAKAADTGADDITEGWLMFLHQLRFLHEWQPDDIRRTLFFAGRGEADSLPRLLHTVPADVGPTWYRTGHQQGVVLPDLGPGLLITAGKPSVTDERGRSTVDTMAVVTMYGIVDGEFGIQRDIWTAWWQSVYPDADEPQS